jgi:hypothetical protein
MRRVTMVSLAVLALAGPCLAGPSGMLRPNLLVGPDVAPRIGRHHPYALTGDDGRTTRVGWKRQTARVGERLERDVFVPRER